MEISKRDEDNIDINSINDSIIWIECGCIRAFHELSHRVINC